MALLEAIKVGGSAIKSILTRARAKRKAKRAERAAARAAAAESALANKLGRSASSQTGGNTEENVSSVERKFASLSPDDKKFKFTDYWYFPLIFVVLYFIFKKR